jgi:hypothetical protein
MNTANFRRLPRPALPLALCVAGLSALVAADAMAAEVPVTRCDDDTSPGSLRYALLTANDKDTVDLSVLTCSKITLGGVLDINQDNVYVSGPGADKLTIDANHAGRAFFHGGTGRLDLAGLTVTGGTYTSVRALGGCIYSKGSVALTDAVVTGCEVRGLPGGSGTGGGGVLAQNLSLLRSRISNNTAYYAGSGATTRIALGGGAAVLNRVTLLFSTVSDNRAYAASGIAAAGGIYVFNGVNAKYSSITGNSASAKNFDPQYSFGIAGGIALNGTGAVAWFMDSCTVCGNRADGAAGLFISGTSATSATIRNSTISGNSASVVGGGVQIGIPMTLANSTVAFNSAGSYGGGGVVAVGSTLKLESTIIADNSPGGSMYAADLDGSAALSGHNSLVRFAGASMTLPAGTLRVDPKLGSLQDNGGRTRTHALLAGSPAIDAGNNTLGLPDDQRGPGFARVGGAAADIGAFEVNSDIIFANGFN